MLLQERLSETHPLVNEAITDYARAMNKITFDHAARTRASGVAGLAMVPLDKSSLQKVETRQVELIFTVFWLIAIDMAALHKRCDWVFTTCTFLLVMSGRVPLPSPVVVGQAALMRTWSIIHTT